jgi:transcriptional antiterminator RfaH
VLQKNVWYALQVVSRHEALTETHLRNRGYDVFRPHFAGDSGKCLFPGYLFLRMVADPLGTVVTTPGVLRIVTYGGAPARVDECELENLRTVMRSMLPLVPRPILPIGCRVRVEGGPLTGVEGVLEEYGSRNRLVIAVTILRRSVAVTFEANCELTRLDGFNPECLSDFSKSPRRC